MLNSRIDKTVLALSGLKGNADFESQINNIASLVKKTLLTRRKILIAGNGGSAAQAQHFSAEIVATLHREKRRGYPAIALTTDTSYLTAWLNDFGREDLDGIFSRQVDALGSEGDIFFGISTSGNSQNIVQAIRKAKELGMKTIGLLGCDGGAIKSECDMALVVPSNDTATIQEVHTLLVHVICESVVPDLS